MRRRENDITVWDLTEGEARVVRMARQFWASDLDGTAKEAEIATDLHDDPLYAAMGPVLVALAPTEGRMPAGADTPATLSDAEERLLDCLSTEDRAPPAAGAALGGECRTVLSAAGVRIRGPGQIAFDTRVALAERIDRASWAVFTAQTGRHPAEAASAGAGYDAPLGGHAAPREGIDR